MGLRHAGRVIVLTGADGDIGRAMARRLAEEGASLALLDLRKPEVLAEEFSDALASECDVSDPASVEAAFAEIGTRWPHVHGVVNNAAAVTPSSTIIDIPLDEWKKALDVNLTGAMLVSRAAIPMMRRTEKHPGGVIVHMASQLGQVGAKGRAAYGATKAGLIQLARAMAVDHADEGLRVLSLSPGAVLTSRLVTRYGSAEATHDALGIRYPIGRLGKPEEVASMAAYLLSDEAAFMTGCDVLVDGGYTAV